MGYDIIGLKSKKSDETISHVSCLYQWQPKFRDALDGVEIIEALSGRVTNKNRNEIVNKINRLIGMIEEQPEMIKLVGCLANKSNDLLVDEFIHLRNCVAEKEIGYISAS